MIIFNIADVICFPLVEMHTLSPEKQSKKGNEIENKGKIRLG